jgi:hypothetical protein
MRDSEKISEGEAEKKYLNDEANEKARENIWIRERMRKRGKISEWEARGKYLKRSCGKISEWESRWESERKYLNGGAEENIWIMGWREISEWWSE